MQKKLKLVINLVLFSITIRRMLVGMHRNNQRNNRTAVPPADYK